MFTQNQFVPTRLSPDQRRAEYHLLYYQFIKHAFGLRFAGIAGPGNPGAIEHGPIAR